MEKQLERESEATEQAPPAKKQPKTGKKGTLFDSASYELNRQRKAEEKKEEENLKN